MSTVSRVLGGGYPTAAKTKQKVLRAVEELDYVANSQARALAGGGAKTVAVLIKSVTTQYQAHIAEGVEEQAVAEGRLSLVCATGQDPERELAYVQLMREQRAGVVVLVGTVVADDAYDARMRQYAQSLAASGSRLALVGRPPLAADVPAVVVEFDNEGGAYAATNHLLSQGHERILYLGKQPGQTTAETRLAGHLRALANYRVDDDESLIVEGRFGRLPGYQMMRDRLDAGPFDFTAVFAGDDLAAAGAIQAMREHGLRVPDDVSMVGYDDLEVAADLGLTTVHIPHEELGRTAVRLALHSGDARSEGARLIHRKLATQLVIRDSVRPHVPASKRR
jgi:LacI family transcriptional regulator